MEGTSAGAGGGCSPIITVTGSIPFGFRCERKFLPLRFERQRLGRCHSIEKDDAVEVIVLVLDDPGVESRRRSAKSGLALDGSRLDLEPSITGHEASQARNGQATFPTLFDLFADGPDFRVDEYGGCDLGLVVGSRHPEGKQPNAFSNLWRREPDTVLLDHRPDHVLAESRQPPGGEPILGHRFGHRPQGWMTETDDLEETGVVAHEISRSPNIRRSCSRWSAPASWGC